MCKESSKQIAPSREGTRIEFKGELVFLGPSFLVFNEQDQFEDGRPAFETLEGTLPSTEAQRLADLLHGEIVSVRIERCSEDEQG